VNTRFDLPHAVAEFQPHLLLMQCHHVTSVPEEQLAAAREANPTMVVVNWNGDVYEEHLTNPLMLGFLNRHVDLQLTVNANVISVYETHGIQSAYWQVAPEPVDYDNLPEVPSHDVVFLANAYTEQRKQLGASLMNMSGVNTGLYGRGWQYANGHTTYDFPTGAAIYRNAQIGIGDNQYPEDYGFVSNRIFEALASGVFLLHQVVPGLEELTGLQDGVHYVAWLDADDLQSKIRYWLDKRRRSKRDRIRDAGRAFVHEEHTFDERARELLLELIPRIQEQQLATP